jgi:hypothetical protein
MLHFGVFRSTKCYVITVNYEESGTWSGSAAVCAEKIGRYLILKRGVYNRNIMKGICSNN